MDSIDLQRTYLDLTTPHVAPRRRRDHALGHPGAAGAGERPPDLGGHSRRRPTSHAAASCARSWAASARMILSVPEARHRDRGHVPADEATGGRLHGTRAALARGGTGMGGEDRGRLPIRAGGARVPVRPGQLTDLRQAGAPIRHFRATSASAASRRHTRMSCTGRWPCGCVRRRSAPRRLRRPAGLHPPQPRGEHGRTRFPASSQ